MASAFIVRQLGKVRGFMELIKSRCIAPEEVKIKVHFSPIFPAGTSEMISFRKVYQAHSNGEPTFHKSE